MEAEKDHLKSNMVSTEGNGEKPNPASSSSPPLPSSISLSTNNPNGSSPTFSPLALFSTSLKNLFSKSTASTTNSSPVTATGETVENNPKPVNAMRNSNPIATQDEVENPQSVSPTKLKPTLRAPLPKAPPLKRSASAGENAPRLYYYDSDSDSEKEREKRERRREKKKEEGEQKEGGEKGEKSGEGTSEGLPGGVSKPPRDPNKKRSRRRHHHHHRVYSQDDNISRRGERDAEKPLDDIGGDEFHEKYKERKAARRKSKQVEADSIFGEDSMLTKAFEFLGVIRPEYTGNFD